MKVKYLFNFVFCQFLAFALFAFLILLLVDNQVTQSPQLLLSYFFNFQHTYILSAPSFLFFLLFWSIIVFVDMKKGKEDYGDAQFASNFEIARMQDNGMYESKGSILGLKDGRYIRTNASLSTLIVAPQGTGKTAAVIIPTLLSDTSSFLVNDIKGELWDKTSKQRANFGRVGIFAPSCSLKNAFCWNPLDEKCLPKDFDNQIDFIDRVGAILYPTEQDGMDATAKHFNAEAKSIFNYYALTLIIKNGGTSLPEIYFSSLESGDMQGSIACDLDDNIDSWPQIITTIANSILQKGGNELQSSISTFKQALEPFSRPNIARNLQRCDFTHLDFKADKPFTLYLFIPANDVSRMAPIVRILVEYLVNEFLSLTDQKIISSQRVVFCMDEFPRMGYMKALKEAPALQRSFNMASIFVAQDKNQLETTYGKGSFDQFVTTTDFKVIFRQNEDTTAARFSNLVGKTTRKKRNISKKDLSLLESSSISSEGVPLILPQDFMSQKKNDLTILVSGYHERPIMAKCAWWFKDSKMKQLIGALDGLTVSDLGKSENNENNENNDLAVTSTINTLKDGLNTGQITENCDQVDNFHCENKDSCVESTPTINNIIIETGESTHEQIDYNDDNNSNEFGDLTSDVELTNNTETQDDNSNKPVLEF
ncbi:TraM recognition domain-containing protein [Aliivibrio fischeri]|uniref:type IV secretory system conjugative DNA transfer family protein n=1 Tax=Aliivibrio fischeri TaxID=668 RepID=UPI0012D96EE4|nr:type IV secretory system conjugative DNA transfer family protein [Aliivibrio fischeri]MUK91891.1 TraM recognition domain-containing protein [Aliivibrio fischeri]